MSSSGREPRSVAHTYAPNVAARRARGTAGGEDRYIHFGHWDAPPAADAVRESFSAAQERYNDRLLELAILCDGQDVLDAGCGFGGTLGAIDARFGRMRLVGENIDPDQLAIAASAIAPRPSNTISWVLGDASELAAFGAGSFDRLLAVECVPHFASRRRFLVHAARVLRPGGRLALSDFVAAPGLLAMRGTSRIPFDVERLLSTGLSPWPDFWGEDGDYATLAAASSLRLDACVDASLETLPSYRAILGDPAPDAGAPDPRREGMRLLEWLQERGLMRLMYAAFEKG